MTLCFVCLQGAGSDFQPFKEDPDFKSKLADDDADGYVVSHMVNVDGTPGEISTEVKFDATKQANVATWVPVGWIQLGEIFTFDVTFRWFVGK